MSALKDLMLQMMRDLNGGALSTVSIMALLGREGRLTMGNVAGHLGLSHSAVSELSKSMALRGLAVKTRDDHDERVVFLSLTAEGKRLVQGWEGLLKP